MGGHGGGIPKLPDYRIYKVENVPELMAVKNALAQKGLKDPWLRNEVWKYDIANKGTTYQIFQRTLGRGVVYGFVAAVITTAIGAAFSKDDHGHGHDSSSSH